jgi:hypothetical protein
LLAKIVVVCVGGFWIFYTIYGTISWLMLIEYNPRIAGLPKSYPKMIFLRFLEFLPFICLYDIVNIMGPTEVKLSANQTEIIPGIAEGVKIVYLNRLSIEIGIILLLWAIWNFVWWFVHPKAQLNDLQKSQPIKTFGLLISGLIFLILYPFLLMHFSFINLSVWWSICLLSIFTIVYLFFDVFFIHEGQYKLLTKALSVFIDKSPVDLS